MTPFPPRSPEQHLVRAPADKPGSPRGSNPRPARTRRPLVMPTPSPLYEKTIARFGLSEAKHEQLLAFVEVLGKWQPKLNLIGPGTWVDVWDRHVVDSLQCLDHAGLSLDASTPVDHAGPATTPASSFFRSPARGIADIGTGAGFPGIVIAIATGHPVTLVESDSRKAAFQLAVKAATGAPLTIVSKRVEALPDKPLDTLFARAFAPLPRLLDWCAPLIDERTQLVLHKGRTARAELEAAQETHSFETESFPSLIDSDSVILRLRNVRRAR